MALQSVHHRRPLHCTTRALAQGASTVGFLGGSISEARPGHNWPEPVLAWLIEQFPTARIAVENAAIGATGSDLAAFRVRRDILSHGCQLVFVEYAVNDFWEASDRRRRAREGVLRQLLVDEERDVVLVYTFCQEMYADMMQGLVPASIAEFEELASHYDLPSIWVGLDALREVMAGHLRWEEWLPDGLHPQSRGSLSYARSVTRFLEQELLVEAAAGAVVARSQVAALDPNHWERAGILPFSAVQTQGPWLLRRSAVLPWIDQLLTTAAVGARLSFSFEGRGLVLAFDFGRTSSEFRYRLDNDDWAAVTRERAEWCPDSGWYRPTVIADDLERGQHSFELEVTHGDRPDCTGTNCHLALIGVLS